MRILTVLVVALAVSGLSLSPRSASATAIVLTGYTADMQSVIDPGTGDEIITLLTSEILFAPGGFAGGYVGLDERTGETGYALPFMGGVVV